MSNVDSKILYVEDEYITRVDVGNMLHSIYKNVYLAKDGNEGYEMFIKYNPDIIITDLKMPNCDGIDMVKKIRSKNNNIPIIVASAFDKEFIKFNNLNIYKYITKPITKFNLLITVETAILKHEN